jgi:hypothetical protein
MSIQESLRDIPPHEFTEVALSQPAPLSLSPEAVARYGQNYTAFFGLSNKFHSRALNQLDDTEFGYDLHSGNERLGLGIQAWYRYLGRSGRLDAASLEARNWLQSLSSTDLLEAIAQYTDDIFTARAEDENAKDVTEKITDEIDAILEDEIPAFGHFRQELEPHLEAQGRYTEEVTNELLGLRLGSIAVRNALIIANLDEVLRYS